MMRWARRLRKQDALTVNAVAMKAVKRWHWLFIMASIRRKIVFIL